MFNSNLEKQNDKNNIKKLQKLLDNPEDQKALNLFIKASPNSVLAKDNSKVGDEIVRDKIQDEFETTAYNEHEIHAECLKYNLTFERMSSYNGEYKDIQYMKDVQKYIEDKKLLASEYDVRDMYILAPAMNDTQYNAFKNGLSDPIIFIKVKREPDLYIKLGGKTTYMTLQNLYLGMKWYSVISLRLFFLLENFIAGLLLWSVICLLFKSMSYDYIAIGSVLCASLIGQFIRMGILESHDSGITHYPSYFNNVKHNKGLKSKSKTSKYI